MSTAVNVNDDYCKGLQCLKDDGGSGAVENKLLLMRGRLLGTWWGNDEGSGD